MKTLIMSSSLTVYEKDKNGNEFARIIDNDNWFLDNLRKYMTIIFEAKCTRENYERMEEEERTLLYCLLK